MMEEEEEEEEIGLRRAEAEIVLAELHSRSLSTHYSLTLLLSPVVTTTLPPSGARSPVAHM